jgi:hypothetical protein
MDTEFWQRYFLENCHLEEEGDGRIMIRWILVKESGQYNVQWQTSPIMLLNHRVLLPDISVANLH